MSKATQQDLAAFDSLPDDALIGEPLVEALLDASDSTRWRLRKDGRLPAVVKIMGRAARSRAGDIRAVLQGQAAGLSHDSQRALVRHLHNANVARAQALGGGFHV